MKQLRIEHNHGLLVLGDVRLEPYEHTSMVNGYQHTYKGNVAKGTVISGYTTNRLFHATYTEHAQPGIQESYDLYGRVPHCTDEVNDVWMVSVQTCG